MDTNTERKEYRPNWMFKDLAFDGKCKTCSYMRATASICEYEGILAWAVKELGDIAIVDGQCQWCNNPEDKGHKDYCVWAMFQDYYHANKNVGEHMCLLLWLANRQRSGSGVIELTDECHCPQLRAETWETQKAR
jgi:hypothetical protein